jgi:ribosomal protein S18 acetylase RimI-like enzyme
MVDIQPLERDHRETVRLILQRAGNFTDEEIGVAMEIIDSYLYGGGQKDYTIYVAVDDDNLAIGFICYGKTPLTDGTYHLYWIVVDPNHQGRGVGNQLLKFMEANLSQLGARMILVETSSTDRYEKTRNFYLANGYREAARLMDYYRTGDSLIIYEKRL